jgi:hypothetical protein
MVTEIESFVKNRKLATFKVENWIGPYTKSELSIIIGISRPTLDTRLKKSNWRMKELEAITEKLPFSWNI